MPAPVRTIQSILVELNGPTGVGEWIRVPNYYALSTPSIGSDTSFEFSFSEHWNCSNNFYKPTHP